MRLIKMRNMKQEIKQKRINTSVARNGGIDKTAIHVTESRLLALSLIKLGFDVIDVRTGTLEI